jgi:hypothetical protein
LEAETDGLSPETSDLLFFDALLKETNALLEEGDPFSLRTISPYAHSGQAACQYAKPLCLASWRCDPVLEEVP